MYWTTVFIMGKDVDGRRCRVASIRVPDYFTPERRLSYIRNLEYLDGHRPWAEIEATDIEESR